jgi:hypothetical protein
LVRKGDHETSCDARYLEEVAQLSIGQLDQEAGQEGATGLTDLRVPPRWFLSHHRAL